jgi:cadmium resistance protein CadD (predicted permease)
VIPYLRLLPLLPGIRAAWSTWRHRRFGDHDEELEHETSAGTRIPHVAAVTFANSGDNIGVYVPVLPQPVPQAWRATRGVPGRRRGVARGRMALRHPTHDRQSHCTMGHVVMPLALIGIGAFILIEGGAFRL